jgi:NAD(P)-dependent dehydrogenase (short-subunit alcohol dehydrogenase family)
LRASSARAAHCQRGSPGATKTDTHRDAKDPEFIAGLERMSAFNRLGRVEEIADVIAFLVIDRRHGPPAEHPRQRRHRVTA